MSFSKDAFQRQVAILFQRYVRQNGLPALADAEAGRFGVQLASLVEKRGLPRRLRVEEMGEPGEMSADEVAPLVDFVLAQSDRAIDLTPVARQLIKACFHPEFRKCRDSYREKVADGSCRRQDAGRVRTRISGSHCIDCPYWTALNPAQHEGCLLEGWAGDRSTLMAHRDLYLPEDFRVFRQLVRAWACLREAAGERTLP